MAVSSDFATWLNKKLKELNTDESVFGSYIMGILEGDEAYEEKHDALEGILSEILSENLEEVVQSILKKFSECSDKKENSAIQGKDLKVEEQLVNLLVSTKIQSIVKEKQYTEEEKRIREQILAHYSQTEVSEEEFEAPQSDTENDKHGSGNSKSCAIEKNTNFSDVVALQKEKREQARQESAAKKQKDKEDREKQKQMREEKKEKRKTVKGERKR